MPVSVTGIEATLQAQKNMAKADAINIAVGLKKCADVLLRASQKLVPVAHPRVHVVNLKEHGKATVTGVGFGAKAAVTYDNYYAAYVHEDLEAYHKPPTQAKYLSAAVPKVRGTMTAILKRQLAAKVNR